MPTEATVLCAHCGLYLPRRREREHRRLATQPYIPPPPRLPSRLRRVGVDTDSDDDVPVIPNEEEFREVLAGTLWTHTYEQSACAKCPQFPTR